MAADMTTTNLRIRLYDAVGGDPDVAQAVWEIVSPVVAEGDVLKAAVADALVLLTGDQIGNPVLPEVRAQIIAQLETALDASTAPESTGDTADMLHSEILAILRRAIADPGSVIPRERGETVSNWSARAVMIAVDEHPVLELRPTSAPESPQDGRE